MKLERGRVGSTYTSQTPLSVQISLPATVEAASSKYRAADDPSLRIHRKVLLIDTPGHAKLRYHAFEWMKNPRNLKGIIFVVDSATLSSQDGGLREAADYLHDILLQLQKRLTTSRTSKAPQRLPVLIAAHKTDLFTALPPILVKKSLEAEITHVRDSRAGGLLDSGVGASDIGSGGEKEWLGERGEGGFDFKQMEDSNVEVKVEGGFTMGGDRVDVDRYWNWIGSNI